MTVIFKLSECQKMVKKLYKNSLKYYPGMSVVVADEKKYRIFKEIPDGVIINF